MNLWQWSSLLTALTVSAAQYRNLVIYDWLLVGAKHPRRQQDRQLARKKCLYISSGIPACWYGAARKESWSFKRETSERVDENRGTAEGSMRSGWMMLCSCDNVQTWNKKNLPSVGWSSNWLKTLMTDVEGSLAQKQWTVESLKGGTFSTVRIGAPREMSKGAKLCQKPGNASGLLTVVGSNIDDLTVSLFNSKLAVVMVAPVAPELLHDRGWYAYLQRIWVCNSTQQPIKNCVGKTTTMPDIFKLRNFPNLNHLVDRSENEKTSLSSLLWKL